MNEAQQRINLLRSYLEREVLDFEARFWVMKEIWAIKMTARQSGQ